MENKATKRTNRLGRGLSALIPDISTEIDKKDIITIDLKNISDIFFNKLDISPIIPAWIYRFILTPQIIVKMADEIAVITDH